MEKIILFEVLLEKHRVIIEKYINFRIPSSFDANDVIQETYCAAYVGFLKLHNKELFKSWILSIARNKCNIWFRKKYGSDLISLDAIADMADMPAQDDESVLEILKLLPQESKLTMHGYKQSEIAERLGVPIDTVKKPLALCKKTVPLRMHARTNCVI